MDQRITVTVVHATDTTEGPYQVYVQRATMAPNGVTVTKREEGRLPCHGVSYERAQWLASKPPVTLARLALDAWPSKED